MHIARTLGRKLSSDRFDAGLCQLSCWGVSILVLVLGILKLTALPLTETELLFGLMLVFAIVLLAWNLAMLVRIESNTRERNRE